MEAAPNPIILKKYSPLITTKAFTHTRTVRFSPIKTKAALNFA